MNFSDPMHDAPSPFSGSERFRYETNELEAMSLADNYYDWILNLFEPYRGDTILEVGAGIGSLLTRAVKKWGNGIQHYIALEPDIGLYQELSHCIVSLKRTNVQCLNGFLVNEISSIQEYLIDTILYVNVLEHVENDQKELDLAAQLLTKGGHILTFSPARPELYSRLDRKLGHYRRYKLSEMKRKVKRAGFQVHRSHYIDLAGYFLWWIKYRLMKHTTIERSHVRLFDNMIVPLMARLEPSKYIPFGKNILVIGRKI